MWAIGIENINYITIETMYVNIPRKCDIHEAQAFRDPKNGRDEEQNIKNFVEIYVTPIH